MALIGYLIVLASLLLLYKNVLILGAIAFFVGGFLAQKVYVGIRGAGVVLLVVTLAYGYHNGFSPLVVVLIVVGAVMASSKSKHREDRNEWGFSIEMLSNMGSDSDGDGGGD